MESLEENRAARLAEAGITLTEAELKAGRRMWGFTEDNSLESLRNAAYIDGAFGYPTVECMMLVLEILDTRIQLLQTTLEFEDQCAVLRRTDRSEEWSHTTQLELLALKGVRAYFEREIKGQQDARRQNVRRQDARRASAGAA